MNEGRLPLCYEFHTFEKNKQTYFQPRQVLRTQHYWLLSVKTTNDRRDEVVLFGQVTAGLITLNTDTAEVVYFRPSGSSCGYQGCHV